MRTILVGLVLAGLAVGGCTALSTAPKLCIEQKATMEVDGKTTKLNQDLCVGPQKQLP